jgi:hypothetical protein
MKKDLIIGGASNYGWEELKYWVNSIKRSGFSGDVVLVATNIKKNDIERLVQEGVKLSLYGKQSDSGDFVSHSNGAPHVERFFYLWNHLNTLNRDEYHHVIVTDTRDVIFQTNPSEWLTQNLITHFLVASSEGMSYKNETWNNQNLYETFGPFFHNLYKEKMIFNVGTIAGDFDYVKSLLFLIFQMSINRPIPIVDQAVYNVLINATPWFEDTLMTSNEAGWAVQLGTTLNAVESGKGDLGVKYKTDIESYLRLYEDLQPSLKNGYVVNHNDEKFCIVHQYDRTLDWKNEIMEKYS